MALFIFRITHRIIIHEIVRTLQFGLWILQILFLSSWFTIIYPLTWPLRMFLVFIPVLLYPSYEPITRGHDNRIKEGSTREYRWITKTQLHLWKNFWVRHDLIKHAQSIDELFLVPHQYANENTSLLPPDGFLLNMLLFIIVVASFIPVFLIGYFQIWKCTLQSIYKFITTTTYSSTRETVLVWLSWFYSLLKPSSILHSTTAVLLYLPCRSIRVIRFCFHSVYDISLSILKQKPKLKLPTTTTIDNCINRSAYPVICQVFESSEDLDSRLSAESFDSDGTICVVDNSANVHIWQQRSDFTSYSKIDDYNVATIGGENHLAHGIGTVQMTWTDDVGHKHKYSMINVLHFPDSPVNILSVTAFANQLDDDDGTSIKTMRRHSIFEWSFGKGQRTIHHPPTNNLPQFLVNEGYNNYALFGQRITKECSSTNFALQLTVLEVSTTETNTTNPSNDLNESAQLRVKGYVKLPLVPFNL